MRTHVAVAIVMIASGASAVRAESAFSGTDAAFIDWAVKNCRMKSTPAEHALVETANAHGRDAFGRQYMKQFESALFKEAAEKREKQDRLCRDVKEWYGKDGTRIQRLLVGEGDPQQPDGTQVQAPKSPERTGGKSGGHGRRSGN